MNLLRKTFLRPSEKSSMVDETEKMQDGENFSIMIIFAVNMCNNSFFLFLKIKQLRIILRVEK